MDSVSGTLVSRVAVGADQASSIAKAVDLIGGWERFISPGDRILLKGQFNSPDRYPASADPGFIRDVVGLLKDAGAGEITLGASSGLAWAPTSAVLRKKKVYELAGELGINLVNFDLGDWFRVDIDGRHLKSVFITRAVLEADRIIYLPHVKTHRYARFTLGLKFAVGLTEPSSRRYLHDSFLEEKVVEINLAVRPDLVIMDGRKCLVTGGPSRGRTKKAGLVLASSDLVALDVEALKVLKSFRARNRLDKPEWDLPQIAAAVRLGLGARKEGDYRLLTA